MAGVRGPANAFMAEAEQIGQKHLLSLADAIKKLHLQYKANVDKVEAFQIKQVLMVFYVC